MIFWGFACLPDIFKLVLSISCTQFLLYPLKEIEKKIIKEIAYDPPCFVPTPVHVLFLPSVWLLVLPRVIAISVQLASRLILVFLAGSSALSENLFPF